MDWVWSLVRELLLGRKAMTNLDCIQRQRDHFVDKGPYSQSYGFSCNHVWMWELDHKEESMFLNCGTGEGQLLTFWSEGQLDKRVQLDKKDINPVNLKGNQPWIFTGRTDAGAEAPIHWPPDAKSQLNGKDSDVWKDWRAGGEGVTEDKMVVWHHQLNGYQSMQTLEDSEGQWSLASCSPWDRNQSQTT